MLFNSYSFIFLFLPVVLFGYFALGRCSHLAPVVWLALASLVFYAVRRLAVRAVAAWPRSPSITASAVC